MNVAFLTEGLDLPRRAQDLLAKADKTIWKGDYRRGREVLDTLKDRSGPLHAMRCALIGDICHFEWDDRGAIRWYQDAIAAIDPSDPIAIFATYRLVDSSLDHELGHGAPLADPVELRKMFDEAEQRAKELDHKFLVAFALHYRGIFGIVDGDYAGARARLVDAANVRREIGDTWHLWNTEWLIARCDAGMGDIAGARREAERIYQLQIKAGLKGAALRVLLGIQQLVTLENLARLQDAKDGVTSMSPDSLSAFMTTVNAAAARYEAPAVGGLAAVGSVLHS